MEITLQAEVREGTGKGVARKLRAAGKVPGIVYGAGGSATAVAIDSRQLAHALMTDAGLNVLVDLVVGDETFLTLARELQRDPIRGNIKHVDFVKVDRNTAIEVDIPIHVVGDAPGMREGGVLEHHIWSVHVSCLPGSVPERVDVDISGMALHDHLRVADLVLPEGVTMLTDPDEPVVTIAIPQVLKVEAELDQPDIAAAEGVPAEGAEAAVPAAGGTPAPAEGGGGGDKDKG